MIIGQIITIDGFQYEVIELSSEVDGSNRVLLERLRDIK
jgi:hypothetical protein